MRHTCGIRGRCLGLVLLVESDHERLTQVQHLMFRRGIGCTGVTESTLDSDGGADEPAREHRENDPTDLVRAQIIRFPLTLPG